MQKSVIRSSFDAVREWTHGVMPFSFGILKPYQGFVFHAGPVRYESRFDVVAAHRSKRLARFESLTNFCRASFSGRFNAMGSFRTFLRSRTDAITDFPIKRYSFRYDSNSRQSDLRLNEFSAIFSKDELPEYGADFRRCRFYASKPGTGRAASSFTLGVNLPHDKRAYRYDVTGLRSSAVRFDWRSFVRPGWKLTARNIDTDILHEIGFIDYDNPERELTGISLPEGEYELIVRTSSLFWQDCHDRIIRRFSVRPGSSGVYVPSIRNLRSTISNGVTTVRWSSECFANMVFGVWFSTSPDIDTSGPPDDIIVALDGVTSYSYRREQTGPEYVAVAAIRDERQGPSAELYLDWNIEAPRRPDDQVAIETSSIDEK